jgi:single-stranded-DNA-specific exonuclease
VRQVALEQRKEGIGPSVRAPEELITHLYRARGLKEHPNYALSAMLPPTLGGLSAATERLADALINEESILVVGDFDADGATATALAVSSLKSMGFRHVDWMIPDRFRHGYGLSQVVLDDIPSPPPQVILTVDQGISSVDGVAKARARGIDVIVTDHHLPGFELPQAVAIVNPNLDGEAFPSRHLAGVGVVFYLMVALRQLLRARGAFEHKPEPRLDQWLDLVAVGTVADLVTLDHNNRLLVAQGIARIRSGQTRPGIRALLEVGNRNLRSVTAADLAFVVAPRLNAAGRLDDMRKGVECLLAQSEREARVFASTLDVINQERKSVQATMQVEANRQANELAVTLDSQLPGACLFNEDWHQGVVGLVAGQIAERLRRPVVAFAPEVVGGDQLKGSARSPGNIHMRDLLVAIDQQAPGLISRFGGHAGAAGLSLPRESLQAFEAEFMAYLSQIPNREERVSSDGALPSHLMTCEVAEAIQEAGPWGQGFPEPLFDGQFLVCERRIVGGEHLKLSLQSIDNKHIFDAIAFRAGGLAHSELPKIWHLTYRLEVNRFRGRSRLQLNIQHWVVGSDLSE